MRIPIFFLLLFLFFAWSVLVHAHNGDGDSLPGGPGSSGINAGSGIMIELGEADAPPQVLVAVSYPGALRETGNEHVSYRYFWVSAQTTVAAREPQEGSVLTSIGLNIVPVSRIEASSNGVISSLKYFPIEVRRALDVGLDASVNVSVIGWTRYNESAVGREPSEHELAKVIKFAQVALDVVGFRFANLQERGQYFASQLASVQMQAGLGWNINRRVSLRISIGGRGAVSVGSVMQVSAYGVMAEDGLNARLQAFFTTAHAILNAYFEAGYHRTDLMGPGFSVGSAEDYHEALHGHPYLMIGAGAAF